MRKEAWGCHFSGQPPLLGLGPGKRVGLGNPGKEGKWRLGTPGEEASLGGRALPSLVKMG